MPDTKEIQANDKKTSEKRVKNHNMSELAKIIYIKCMRGLNSFFYFIPIKQNRVLFESFSGAAYNCNPKYISEMLEQLCGSNVEIVWALKNPDGHADLEKRGIRLCKYRSIRHHFYKLTSKIFVSNFLQASEVAKRRKQIWIQTWHGGGCYKKIGSDSEHSSKIKLYRQSMQVGETDYFIASSSYFEKHVIKRQLGFQGKILECGMPRNDVLCHSPKAERISEIRRAIGISDDTFAVLFAPTWREGLDKYEAIDVQRIKNAFEKRFQKPCEILFRAHLYGTGKANGMIDVTAYEDMQDLLYACDCLITDYSSSMWDFSLTQKPCFLFTPDLEEYSELRGFDKDIQTWGFPVCISNDALVQSIACFSEDSFAQKMKQHQADLNSFEHGEATEFVVNLIRKKCGV